LAIKKVVVKFVDELKDSLMNKNIRLNLSESVVDLLADKGYDSKMGARPLGRKIDELIRVPLSKKILFDRLENCNISAIMVNDQVDFVIEPPMLAPVVDSEGYIILDQNSPTV
jgi:ATP-dependent Clp protease ATP-binding subunit ClpA